MFFNLVVQITSDFSRSGGEWSAEEDETISPVAHDQINKLISIQSNRSGAYFLAPSTLNIFKFC